MDDDTARGRPTVRYAHPGHDRIARESLELRQRENELRGRWKEMGFQLPQVCSDNETPFTLPEPISVDDNVVVTPGQQQQQQQQQVLESRDQQDCSAPVTPTNGSRQPATTSRVSAVKVHPFEDDDNDDRSEIERRVGSSGYSPAVETPIQREIRLTSEREQLLRESRGLPVVSPVSRQSLASQTDRDDAHHRTSNGVSDLAGHSRVSMRQLASSRMALELEREKERELDLRRLGCISTISEERRPQCPSEQHGGCLANGHVTGGGAWLIEREVQVAKERELELQMQRARLSTSGCDGGVTSSDDDTVARNHTPPST